MKKIFNLIALIFLSFDAHATYCVNSHSYNACEQEAKIVRYETHNTATCVWVSEPPPYDGMCQFIILILKDENIGERKKLDDK